MVITRDSCPICAVFGERLEIENPQEPSELDSVELFPDGVELLSVANAHLEAYYRYRSERLLKCPACQTYFWYRRWAPGGSEDVMRTYIHESISRLDALAVHKELHSALYEAARRGDEYGGSFREEATETELGVQEELAALRARYREIIAQALSSLEDKHAHSRRLAEWVREFYPQTGEQQVAEAREREERVAAYHAEILAEYLPYYGDDPVEPDLLSRLHSLLSDDNEHVRATVGQALMSLLDRPSA